MNDCPNGDMRDLLPDLLHDRLGAAERGAVKSHLLGCADCREELDLLRDMNRALRRVPAVSVADIVAALPVPGAPARRSWGGWRVAAAIAFVAAGGTSVALLRQQPVAVDQTAVVSPALPAVVAVVADSAPVDVAATRGPADGGTAAVQGSGQPPELAVASAAIGDLDESELAALLDDIGSLDAVTPADVDTPAAVSPIAPGTAGEGA